MCNCAKYLDQVAFCICQQADSILLQICPLCTILSLRSTFRCLFFFVLWYCSGHYFGEGGLLHCLQADSNLLQREHCAQIVQRLCALLGLKSPFSRPCATQHKVTLWAILHWALIMGRWLVARQFKSVALRTFCNCDSYLLADCIWKATVAQKIRGWMVWLVSRPSLLLALNWSDDRWEWEK